MISIKNYTVRYNNILIIIVGYKETIFYVRLYTQCSFFYCLLIISFTYLSYLQKQTVKRGYHKVFGECKIDPHLPVKRNTLFSCLTTQRTSK